jgi:hypothetical protein
MEENLRRAMLIARGDVTVFMTRPISAGLLAVALVLLTIAALPMIRQRRDEVFVEEAFSFRPGPAGARCFQPSLFGAEGDPRESDDNHCDKRGWDHPVENRRRRQAADRPVTYFGICAADRAGCDDGGHVGDHAKILRSTDCGTKVALGAQRVRKVQAGSYKMRVNGLNWKRRRPAPAR